MEVVSVNSLLHKDVSVCVYASTIKLTCIHKHICENELKAIYAHVSVCVQAHTRGGGGRWVRMNPPPAAPRASFEVTHYLGLSRYTIDPLGMT